MTPPATPDRLALQPLLEMAEHWHRLGILDWVYLELVRRLSDQNPTTAVLS